MTFFISQIITWRRVFLYIGEEDEVGEEFNSVIGSFVVGIGCFSSHS